MKTNSPDNQSWLTEWSSAWKNQPVEQNLNFTSAYRQQARRRRLFYMDLSHALALFVAGLLFFYLPSSLPTLIGIPVLLLSSCLVGWSAFKIHLQVMRYADWSAHGLLIFRRLNYLSSIQYCRLNQLSCVIVFSFALVMIVLSLSLPGSVPELMAGIYAACLPGLALLMWWLQRRIKRYHVNVAQIEKLINDFEEASNYTDL